MGRRGPPKTPTALNRLRGNPGKRKAIREAKPPQPPLEEMGPPAWLDQMAKAEWRRLAPQLVRLGLLTVLDVTKFAAYCRWYARWRKNEAQLLTMQTELVTLKSGYAQQHPLVAMAKQAAEMMNRFGSQFGLSASDRASISLPLDPTSPTHDKPDQPPPVKPRDEFEDFLRKNRKGDVTTGA